jgi:hypothetical protein
MNEAAVDNGRLIATIQGLISTSAVLPSATVQYGAVKGGGSKRIPPRENQPPTTQF